MAHTLFQTAQIMPINTQIIPTKSNSKPHLPVNFPTSALKHRKCSVRIRASLSTPVKVDDDPVNHLERCLVSSPNCESPCSPSNSSSSSSAGAVDVRCATKKSIQQLSSVGVVTLEKPKSFEYTQQLEKKSSPELSTGGGGGDIGKKIFHGGGDGGDDGGDDDDYFDDFDEEDDGDNDGLFRRRIIFQELFDREFVDAVMNEWMKTMMDLPAGFRQAYEMGLVSSAQMVKFLSINARPTTARAISRSIPQGISRAFIGRMIADPAFLYRLLLEHATTIGCSVWWELKNRKERIKQEWDLALINVLTVTACNAIVMWSLAPCRSYGNTFRFDLQNTLQKLPNNIFENSYYLREFDLQKRIHSFFYKAAELCLVGMTSGAAQGALSNLCASKKEQRVSVTIPSVSTNALGYGAFLGIYANLRYQLLCGIDRVLTNYFDVIGVPLFFTTALRVLNVQLGEASRLAWLGVESDPLASENLLKAYERPAGADSKQSSGWSISNNWLGLLGLKQDNQAESNAPKPRRKKIVRRKVRTSA